MSSTPEKGFIEAFSQFILDISKGDVLKVFMRIMALWFLLHVAGTLYPILRIWVAKGILLVSQFFVAVMTQGADYIHDSSNENSLPTIISIAAWICFGYLLAELRKTPTEESKTKETVPEPTTAPPPPPRSSDDTSSVKSAKSSVPKSTTSSDKGIHVPGEYVEETKLPTEAEKSTSPGERSKSSSRPSPHTDKTTHPPRRPPLSICTCGKADELAQANATISQLKYELVEERQRVGGSRGDWVREQHELRQEAQRSERGRRQVALNLKNQKDKAADEERAANVELGSLKERYSRQSSKQEEMDKHFNTQHEYILALLEDKKKLKARLETAEAEHSRDIGNSRRRVIQTEGTYGRLKESVDFHQQLADDAVRLRELQYNRVEQLEASLQIEAAANQALRTKCKTLEAKLKKAAVDGKKPRTASGSQGTIAKPVRIKLHTTKSSVRPSAHPVLPPAGPAVGTLLDSPVDLTGDVETPVKAAAVDAPVDASVDAPVVETRVVETPVAAEPVAASPDIEAAAESSVEPTEPLPETTPENVPAQTSSPDADIVHQTSPGQATDSVTKHTLPDDWIDWLKDHCQNDAPDSLMAEAPRENQQSQQPPVNPFADATLTQGQGSSSQQRSNPFASDTAPIPPPPVSAPVAQLDHQQGAAVPVPNPFLVTTPSKPYYNPFSPAPSSKNWDQQGLSQPFNPYAISVPQNTNQQGSSQPSGSPFAPSNAGNAELPAVQHGFQQQNWTPSSFRPALPDREEMTQTWDNPFIADSHLEADMEAAFAEHERNNNTQEMEGVEHEDQRMHGYRDGSPSASETSQRSRKSVREMEGIEATPMRTVFPESRHRDANVKMYDAGSSVSSTSSRSRTRAGELKRFSMRSRRRRSLLSRQSRRAALKRSMLKMAVANMSPKRSISPKRTASTKRTGSPKRTGSRKRTASPMGNTASKKTVTPTPAPQNMLMLPGGLQMPAPESRYEKSLRLNRPGPKPKSLPVNTVPDPMPEQSPSSPFELPSPAPSMLQNKGKGILETLSPPPEPIDAAVEAAAMNVEQALLMGVGGFLSASPPTPDTRYLSASVREASSLASSSASAGGYGGQSQYAQYLAQEPQELPFASSSAGLGGYGGYGGYGDQSHVVSNAAQYLAPYSHGAPVASSSAAAGGYGDQSHVEADAARYYEYRAAEEADRESWEDSPEDESNLLDELDEMNNR